jgi:hypothetical protein
MYRDNDQRVSLRLKAEIHESVGKLFFWVSTIFHRTNTAFSIVNTPALWALFSIFVQQK